MPRKPSMTTLASVASVVVVAGAMTNAGIRDQALAILEGDPPMVHEVDTEVARFPDDGLHRIIVTPLDSVADTLPETTTLQAGELTGDDESERPPVVYGHPAVDELATERAVESIVAIGDGSFAVVTEDVSIIDPAAFSVLEDVPMTTTGEPHQGYQWALENDGSSLARVGNGPAQVADVDIDWTAAMGVATGEGVVVAIIDSSIDPTHTDVAGSLWVNENERCGNGVDDDGNGFVDDCDGWDFGNNDNKPYEMGANSHGTHVGGIVSADVNGIGVAGVAPLSQLMNLNVETRYGYGSSISLSSVAAAVRYAADNGADIVNMSLGTSPGTSAAAVQVLGDAIAYAETKGVIVVVSAGNNGVNLDSTAIYPASFDLPNMVVVGASTPADERASFSNYSTSIVDIFAPGEYILSTTPTLDYEFMSGTSQAAPIVSGVLALVRQANPDLSPSAVVQKMLDGAEVVETLAPWGRAGARVNAAGALGIEGHTDTSVGTLRDPIVTVTGLDTTEKLGGGAFLIDADIAFDIPQEYFSEAYHWELAVVADAPAGPAALFDYPVVIDGANTSTGESGAVWFAPGGAQVASIETSLPVGRYAFLLEAVAEDDPTSRLGAPFAVSFTIADSGAVNDLTTGGGTTTTTAPTTPTTSPSTGSGDSSGSDSSGTTSTTAGSSGGSDDDPWWIDWEPIGSGATSTIPGSTSATTVAPSTTVATAPDGNSADSGTGGNGGSTGGSSGGSSETTPTTSMWWAPTTTWSVSTSWVSSGDPSNTSTTQQSTSGQTGADSGTSTGGSGSGSTLDPGEGAAENGEWSITGFSTQVGFVDSASYITLTGTFPDEVYVWFGDSPGTVVSQRPRSITVLTPVVSTPGVVDVTLRRTPNQIVLTVAQAFAFWYVDTVNGWYQPPAEGGDTGSGSTGSGSTGSGSTGSGSTGSGSTGGSADTTTTTAPSASSGSGGTTTTTRAPSDSDGGSEDGSGTGSDDGSSDAETSTSRAPRTPRSRIGAATDLGNGLTGGILSDVDPFAFTTDCVTASCEAAIG